MKNHCIKYGEIMWFILLTWISRMILQKPHVSIFKFLLYCTSKRCFKELGSVGFFNIKSSHNRSLQEIHFFSHYDNVHKKLV